MNRSGKCLMLASVFASGAFVFGAGPAVVAPAPADGAEAIVKGTPWRVFLVCSLVERKAKGKEETVYTALPPTNWAQADFDDSGWGRYGADLYENVGGYGFGQSASTAVLCMRTRFGVSDPALVRDLTLTLEYRGGVVVFLNGSEIARQHLPREGLELLTHAEDYPAEAFVGTNGAALAGTDRPADKELERYEQRVRRLAVTVPATVLRKGANVLSVELHAVAPGKVQGGGRNEWSTAGLCDAKLTSRTGAGVVPYADALKATTIWNASPLETIAVNPGRRQAGFLWWGITVTPVGLTRANPFDTLRPIRACAPRGGTCSGQVVVSGAGPFTGLKAAIGPLKNAGGKTLPQESVRVAFAMQDKDEVFCNALMPQPIDGAPVQPVWVLVDVPRDQQPGWYTGELNVRAGDVSAKVPVQVLVSGWALTDPRDNATLVSLYQSPDTLAQYYKVDPWSDRHFALIEKSMRVVAGMGNDVLLVPVVVDNYLNHKNGLVRWVRKGGGYEPEFSAFERYLDLHAKVFGKPKVVTLSVWKHDFGTRTWFRGMKSDVVKPCMVTEFDPATGKMTPMQAPHFGEPGSEEFWTAMIEGVRRIVKARGCDDRFLLLGEGFDSRPLQPVVDFFKKIEPTMRWQIYSHFDGQEPPVKDGKFICHGGFEVGFRINPNGGSLPELDRNYPKVQTNEFLLAQAERTEIHHTSSPLSYRVVMRTSGTLARIGADFWPIMVDDRGRRRSYYGCPPNEGWLWRGHVPALTGPGPDGAVITSRGQMLLEGVQEAELLIAFIRAKQKATPEVVARINKCLAARGNAGLVGSRLPQAAIGLDFSGMAAREYTLAAEWAGTPDAADWTEPPLTPGGVK